MSEKRKRPKAIIERGLKTCTLQIIGKRYAVNPETLKPMSALFSLVGTFSIEETKKNRYREWSFTKIVRPYRFSWMNDFAVKTVISLTDGKSTQIIKPTQNFDSGVEFEITEPKKITAKEAQVLIDLGASVYELDENDNLKGLAIVKFR